MASGAATEILFQEVNETDNLWEPGLLKKDYYVEL